MQDPFYSPQQPQIRYTSSKPHQGGASQVVQVGSGYGGTYSLQGGGGGYQNANDSPFNQYAQPQERLSSMSGTQPVYQQYSNQPQQQHYPQPPQQQQARIVMTPQQSNVVVQPKSNVSGRPNYPEHVTIAANDQPYYDSNNYQQYPQVQQATQQPVKQYPQNNYQNTNTWSDVQPQVAPTKVQNQQTQPKYNSVQQMASTVVAHSNMRRSAAGGGGSVSSEGEKFDPPRFLMPLDPQVHLREGEPVTFTTKVAPFGDSTLSVEWYKNGLPLCAGSRLNTTFQRGFAILDILYTFAEDTGTYFCIAKSRSGMDQSSSAYLQVEVDPGVIHETQLPDDEMMQNLVAMEDTMYASQRSSERYEADPSGGRPPQFLKPLTPQQVTVRENSAVHLETKVAPAGDPNLVVDWFKNGMPLNMGCRFTVTFDRGFAILDIQYAYPEDSGQYFCIAKNAFGQAQSNVVAVNCLEGANIITQSALPPESVEFLRNMDAPGDVASRYEDFRYQEQEEVDAPPNFDIFPEAQTVPENGPARFLVKISGHPQSEVIWLQNDEQLTVSSQYRIYNDGAINYLEFYRCSDIGRSQIRVIAQNSVGQVYADTELVVIPANDFRPELRHIAPDNPFKRMVALKKVETTPELENAFKRPKGHVEQMMKIQKNTEFQTRNFKPDVEEAENLYMTIQSRLRQASNRSTAVSNQQNDEDSSSFQEAQELQRKLQQQQQQRMQMHLQQQQQQQQQPQQQQHQVKVSAPQQQHQVQFQQPIQPQQQQPQHSQLNYQVNAPTQQQMNNFQPQSFTISPSGMGGQPQQQQQPQKVVANQMRPVQQQQSQQRQQQQQPQVHVEEEPMQKVVVTKRHSQPQRMIQPEPSMPPAQNIVIQEYELPPAQQYQQQQHVASGHHAISYQSPPNQGIISMPVLSDCFNECSLPADEIKVEPQPPPHVEEEVIEAFKAPAKPKWNPGDVNAEMQGQGGQGQ